MVRKSMARVKTKSKRKIPWGEVWKKFDEWYFQQKKRSRDILSGRHYYDEWKGRYGQEANLQRILVQVVKQRLPWSAIWKEYDSWWNSHDSSSWGTQQGAIQRIVGKHLR